jgi:tetratricopeptide (TPR) repeat protein
LAALRNAYSIRSSNVDLVAVDLADIAGDVGLVTRDMALLAEDSDQLHEALEWHQEALRLALRAHGPEYVEALRIQVGIGNICFELGDYERARDLLEPAVKGCHQAFGKHPNSALADLRLARLHVRAEEFERAEQLVRAAIETYGDMYGITHPYVAEALAELGPVLCAVGRLDEAEEELRRTIALVETSYGTAHPKLVVLLEGMAEVRRRRGATDGDEWADRAEAIRRTALTPGSPAGG